VVTDVIQKLFGHLIHTAEQPIGIIGMLVILKNVLHVTGKGCIGIGWDASLFFSSGFEFVFFSTE
jgi:hypothetical protein